MDWIAFVLLVVVAASTGAIFKPGAWYEDLKKPSWTPPGWMFPLVWTVLYAGIAWAGVLVWRSDGATWPLVFWAAQWVFNSAWSGIFFGRRRMDLAFVDICLLWLAVLGFIATAWSHSPLASVLFIPYLAWVTTAALLNRAVWRMNPEQVGGGGRSGSKADVSAETSSVRRRVGRGGER